MIRAGSGIIRLLGWRMRKQDLPYIIAVALSISIAVGSGFYMIGGGTAPLLAIVIAVLSLGASQTILLVWASRRSLVNANEHTEILSDLAATHRSVKDNKIQTESLQSNLEEATIEINQQRTNIAHGFSELKESYASLLASMQPTSQYSPPQSASHFQSAFTQPESAMPESLQQPEPQSDSPFGDQLAISLEPIIDISSGRTAHYRMHLALADAQGEEMAADLLLHHAERIGARPALDIFVAHEADGLLRKLRQRDPQLRIFMPIGASTLASPESIAQINAFRKSASDVSAGLVFEFPHTMLAGLAEQSLEGLASLARQGARFALSNVSIAGLDLTAMNTLNVRFVSLDASAIDPVHGPSLAMASFTQTARASRVQMIVSGVADQRIISKLPQITRLASGPCFASPRRVKKDAVENAATDFHAAA